MSRNERAVERIAGVVNFLDTGLQEIAYDLRTTLTDAHTDPEGFVEVRRSLVEIGECLGEISALGAELTTATSEALERIREPDDADPHRPRLYARLLSPIELPHEVNGDGTTELYIQDDHEIGGASEPLRFRRSGTNLGAWNTAMWLRGQDHFTVREAVDLGFGANSSSPRMTLPRSFERMNEALGIEVFQKEVVRRVTHFRVNESVTLVERRPEMLVRSDSDIG